MTIDEYRIPICVDHQEISGLIQEKAGVLYWCQICGRLTDNIIVCKVVPGDLRKYVV